MRLMDVIVALAWCWCAGHAAAMPTPPPIAESAAVSAPASASPDDPARQLLVMLRLPKAHYRPDSSYAGSYGDGVGLQARQRVAGALATQHQLEFLSEWPMPLAGVDCFVMRLAAGDARAPDQVAETLSQDSRVAWAQPMHVYQTRATYNDPLYAAQPAAQQWHLADLHELATGRGVRIAVIDSGIAAQHPDLAGQVLRNENFVDEQPLVGESHGTAVAGIIAARANNGVGIAGIAPQAKLLGLRACWQAPAGDTRCTTLSLAKALNAAVLSGAQIINMSLTGPDDRLLGLLVDQALERGAAVVAAFAQGPDNFPARHPGVLAVGDALPLPAGAVLAPGNGVPSATPDGGWGLVSGTSFSAAHVSGLLALMLELQHQGNGRPIRAALVTDSTGQIDACATLMRRTTERRGACGSVAVRQTVE